ncbi:hypothetical protein DKX38_019726 [Salix brachista]|uniref:Protein DETOXIFICATION n=1 Tax=Salix brachista TaxID=2182728 RepID=A0A5N5KH25_9ROSI|nr:hypothetical protein DKX38_019726 [Salix brachista]
MDNSMEERLVSPEELSSDDLKKRVWKESREFWGIAFPGIVARLTSFGMIVVTQLFMGHVSELDLAAFGLQQSILIRFVNGILIGMSSATETLCGQAYGAGQYHMMGIYLQRSWIIDGVSATILLPLFIFTEPILKLLGQEDDIAKEAGKMSLWFIPILYYYVFSLTIQMFLQAQKKNKIVGLFTASSFVVHVLLSWLFVIKLGLGVAGAMSAFIISAWLLVVEEFVYIFGGWCPLTWKGFTKAAFADMLPLLKLSLSSGVMICLEFWYTSILVLLAGCSLNSGAATDEEELMVVRHALGLIVPVLLRVCIGCKFMDGIWRTTDKPSGLKGTAEGKGSVCIPSLLSSGATGMDEQEDEAEHVITAEKHAEDSSRAADKTAENSSLAAETSAESASLIGSELVPNAGEGLAGSMCCLPFICASSVRVSNELGKGNAKAARFSIKVALVTSVIIGILFCVLCLVFSDEISSLFTSSVAIGAGVQSTVAFLNLGSYYVIGVPIGLVLGYVAHLQIRGLWIGLLSGVVVLTLLLSYLTWRTDWDEQVHKAADRLGRFFLEPPKESVENSNLA